jgi:hypothetical protein
MDEWAVISWEINVITDFAEDICLTCSCSAPSVVLAHVFNQCIKSPGPERRQDYNEKHSRFRRKGPCPFWRIPESQATLLLPLLSLLEGAMPKLQRLELRFRVLEGSYGLENLDSLQQVVLRVSQEASETTRVKVSDIRRSLSMHQNKPTVVVDECYVWSKWQSCVYHRFPQVTLLLARCFFIYFKNATLHLRG